VTTKANPPKIKFGQVVLHGDQQTLHFDLTDMNKLTTKIEEVIEFQRKLSIKLNLENLVLNSVLS
jgi:hypothetical protein